MRATAKMEYGQMPPTPFFAHEIELDVEGMTPNGGATALGPQPHPLYPFFLNFPLFCS